MSAWHEALAFYTNWYLFRWCPSTGKDQSFQVAVRLTREEYRAIRRLASGGVYRSAADFARAAIREKLAETEVISVRENPRDVSAAIEAFLAKNPGPHFVSEIAEKLGIELGAAFEVVTDLVNRGRIRRSKGRT